MIYQKSTDNIDKNELNTRQENFCREYSICANGTQSAIKAGYSRATAESQASRLLRNVKVKTRIAALQAESAKRCGITLDRVMEELANIAFGSIKDIAGWTESRVTMKPSSELSEEQLKVISEVSETSSKQGSPQLHIRMHSKLRALEALVRVFEIQKVEARLNELEEAIKHRG